jgi:hypothetical protein
LNFCQKSSLVNTPEKKKFLFELVDDMNAVTVERYRGSLNGFNPMDFHKIADKIGGPTISLFQLSNGDVIGGFTCA